MIIWVAQKNTPTWAETWDSTYPGLSADSRSWAWSKGQELYETVYNAYCELYNRDLIIQVTK